MIANDSEAPESWLEWFGWRKLVFGFDAHRRWHYTGPLGQPNRHVKWFIRSVGAPDPETAINLWHSLVAWVTGTDPPWIEEWREAVEAEAEEDAEEEAEAEVEAPACDSHSGSSHQVNGSARLPADAPRALKLLHLAEQDALDTHALGNGKVHAADDFGDGASTTSSVRSARALAQYKRVIALTGFFGVYVTWALFAWFIFVRARAHLLRGWRADMRHCACARFMGCSSTSCWATRRSRSLRVRALRFPQLALSVSLCLFVRFSSHSAGSWGISYGARLSRVAATLRTG